MARQLDQASLEALKLREGLRLEAYQDTGGVWTIGYGHTGDVKQGDVIDEHQAEVLLQHDVGWACGAVERGVAVTLSDNQFGALVSFCYNVGAAAFASSTLLRKLNAGDYESVPTEMLRWVKVKGITDNGLVNRRNSEGGQWVRGAYVRGATITPDAPPPIWKHPLVVKGAGAIAASVAGIGADSVKSAADVATSAAQHWSWFGIVAAVLTAMLVVWMLFDHHKST